MPGEWSDEAGQSVIFDMSSVVPAVLVSVVLSLGGALAIARFAGPAQQAYTEALKGRLNVVTGERDDCTDRIKALELRITFLEQEMADLHRESDAKDREIADLYRRLNSAPAPRRRSAPA